MVNALSISLRLFLWIPVVYSLGGFEPKDKFLGLIDRTQFANCLNPPPKCPNENVTFHLYTSANQVSPEMLDVSRLSSLKNAKFLKGRPIKVIIHGYTGDKDYSPNIEIRPAYLAMDMNVISVDYGPLAKEPCYISAAYNVPLVANCTAQLLDRLIAERVVPLADIHVVGFSLGAQVAGHVHNFLKSGLLERVTGLDPAMPLFMGPYRETKLDITDAKFVDVIHTNAGRKGKVEPSGHIDFYVNGGTHQPGCNEPDIDNPNGCSHVRAPIYFAESILESCGFYGTLCTSYLGYLLGWCRSWGQTEKQLMGEYVNQSARGIFFLETNSHAPFGRGMNDSCTRPVNYQNLTTIHKGV